MSTGDKLREVPLAMRPPPARFGSVEGRQQRKKRRTVEPKGRTRAPTPVKIRSVEPRGRKKGRTPASSDLPAEEKPSSDLPAASYGLLEPKEVPKPSWDTKPVMAWKDARLPTPVYVREGRLGVYHSYPDLDGGPFENLDAIEKAFHTYARGGSTADTSKETLKEFVVRESLHWSDGTKMVSTILEITERETQNVHRLLKALLDKKKDDDETFMYELKDIVHWQSICEGRPHAWYYHLNITMATKGADDDASNANLFFAEVTLDPKDMPGCFLSSFCEIKPNSKDFPCHGCMNNGSTDMKHPTSDFYGGHVNTVFPLGFGPCNDKQCCIPQNEADKKAAEELRKKKEQRIIASLDYLDDPDFSENVRNERAELLALNS